MQRGTAASTRDDRPPEGSFTVLWCGGDWGSGDLRLATYWRQLLGLGHGELTLSLLVSNSPEYRVRPRGTATSVGPEAQGSGRHVVQPGEELGPNPAPATATGQEQPPVPAGEREPAHRVSSHHHRRSPQGPCTGLSGTIQQKGGRPDCPRPPDPRRAHAGGTHGSRASMQGGSSAGGTAACSRARGLVCRAGWS